MRFCDFAERFANLPGHILDMRKVERSMVSGWDANAYDGSIRTLDRFRARGCCFEQAAFMSRVKKRVKAGLHDRGLTSTKTFDFLRMDIDANDFVALFAQAASRHRAYITQAKNADSHWGFKAM